MDNCSFKDLKRLKSIVSFDCLSVNISNCTFENCGNGVDNGGALSVSINYDYCKLFFNDINSTCSINGCEFKGCYAKNGGAIYLYISGDVKIISFQDNKFDNNYLNNSSPVYGYDILIASDDISKIVTEDNFSFLKGLKEDDKSAYRIDVSLNNRYLNLANLVNGYKTLDNLYLSNYGNDENNCLDENNTCQTLDLLFDEYIFYNHNNLITIVGDYSITSSTDLEYSSYCTYTGFDETSKIIFGYYTLTVDNTTIFKSIYILIRNTLYGTYFITSTGPLIEFSNITFTIEIKDMPIYNALIKVNYDLKINSCKFESLFLDYYCYLFEYDNNYNNLIISNSLFNNCSRKNGGGLCMYDDANIDESCKINITGCSFSECKASYYSSTGYGGGIYLCLTYYANIELTNIAFTDCVGTGKNIFIETDLNNYLDFNKLFPDFPSNTESGDYLVGSDDLSNVINKMGKSPDTIYYIGEAGTSGNDCSGGVFDKLCKYYNDCSDNVKYNIFNVIVVGNTLDHYDGKLKCNIKGENDK